MTPFRVHRVGSVEEAVGCLRRDPQARLLAGGQSLLAAMKLGLSAPTALIDLGAIASLRQIRLEGPALEGAAGPEGLPACLWLGAMCTHAQVASSAEVRKHLPGLARLAGGIADAQVRNRGTLGGSLANADPAACWPAGVLACGATLVTDRRAIGADEFFQGLFQTALQADEVLLGVRLALPQAIAYLKEEQAASRFALAGVAVARCGDEVRVAVTGLGQGVFRWHAAEQALQRRFEPQSLIGRTPDALRAGDDLHASAEYRLHLAGVLARRAVAQMTQQMAGRTGRAEMAQSAEAAAGPLAQPAAPAAAGPPGKSPAAL